MSSIITRIIPYKNHLRVYTFYTGRGLNMQDYYLANRVLGKSLCSDCFFLCQDFAVLTISMETIQSVYFRFGAKLPEEAKKTEIFPKFQRRMERTNIFKCNSLEVHFTIRNRVPYNKQVTNPAYSGHIGEYRLLVIAVRQVNIPQYGPCTRLVSG